MSCWPPRSPQSPELARRYVAAPFPVTQPFAFNSLPQTVVYNAQNPTSSTGTGLRKIEPRIGPPRPSYRAPPDAIDSDGKENVKGRKRPLSPNSRATALRVRIIGACARCHEKHEQCSEERPCKPCMSTAKRSLDFFCMPELPRDRHVHLFTDHLYGHLSIKEGRLLIPKATLDPTNKPFKLRLVQYFDTPELFVPVIKFEPESENDLRKLIFPIKREGSEYKVAPDEILSPPLVPFLEKDDLVAYIEKFKTAAYQWLDYADRNDNIEWHNEYFREEFGKAWPRSVLQTVCQFYHQVMRGGCKPLRTALQSTILVFMIGHSFYVPEEDIRDVLDRTGLGHYYSGEFMFVAPQYVNRFIKVLLYQFLKATVRLALKCYQDLCSPHKHTRLDRDRILAVSIILLIVAGSIQSKAMEKAEASRLRNGPVNNHQYYERIEEIEKWIVNLVCDIWIYKFGKSGKIKPDDEPNERIIGWEAKRFNLMERFRSSYESHGKFLSRPCSCTGSGVYPPKCSITDHFSATELNSLPTHLPSEAELQRNWKTFGATNNDRILKKFYLCVYGTANKNDSDSQGRVKRETASGGNEREPKLRR